MSAQKDAAASSAREKSYSALNRGARHIAADLSSLVEALLDRGPYIRSRLGVQGQRLTAFVPNTSLPCAGCT